MNAKIEKTKRKLISAFLTLLEETPLEEMTVSQLCREAGINRTTFYKYYSVPQDLADQCLASFLDRMLSEVHIEKHSPYDILLEFCTRFQKSPPVFRAMLSEDGMSKALVPFMERLWGRSSLREETAVYFICGGSATVFTRWCKYEPDIPAEVIAQKLSGYIDALLKE